MSPAILDETTARPPRTFHESAFRLTLIICSVIAGVGVLCHLALMFWARNEFTQPESIVAAQSMMLARDGTLYYDLNHFPYTVCAYMPLFYLLEAALIKLGLGAFLAGRILSFGALLGIFALGWRLALLYTGNRYCAWTATLLSASTSLLLSWGTVAQVDTLAVFFSVAAFYCYSRYAIRGEKTLILAGVFVIAAVFTKQTFLACPAAISLALFLRRPKLGLQFAAGVGAPILVAIIAINGALHGRFLNNVLFANLNPFAVEKIGQHVNYLLIGAGQLIIIVMLGARSAWRGPGRDLLIYLGFAFAILAATAAKVGSDSNYQVEPTFVLILCACIALESLDFFGLLFRGSKTWIPLLQLCLGIHLLLNYRITASFLATRFANEKLFRAQIAALRPYLSGDGRVLSAEMNALAQLRGRIEVEVQIYKLLVRAGRIDPEPLRRDIARQAFAVIVLYQDLSQPIDTDLEVPTLPESQRNEIRRRYRLVKHIPGPYLRGVYLYEPAGSEPAGPRG
jgi:hypothetical protein